MEPRQLHALMGTSLESIGASAHGSECDNADCEGSQNRQQAPRTMTMRHLLDGCRCTLGISSVIIS